MEKSREVATTKKPQLPALVIDLGLAIKVDNFNQLLNTQPPKDWFKTHKGNDYIPIDRVKNNLVIIFQDYDWCIKDIKILANSILVYGTLSIVNPVTGRTRNLDGVGAWPIQLDSGAKPLEIEKIKQDAIQKNAPAAESMALSNAAKKLGKLFGGGDDTIEFIPRYSAEVPLDEIKNAHASN